MIFNILQKLRHIRQYDETYIIDKTLINDLLYKTWKVTPSKNNFMPYKIHVIGPDNNEFKKQIYKNCVSQEDYMNSFNEKNIGNKLNDNYKNILNCSYLLVFTSRIETDPNPMQKMHVNQGIYLEPLSEKGISSYLDTISLEVGLFANTLAMLCLENNLDISYTLCFRRDLSFWKKLPFIKNRPILLMTVGKGKISRRQEMEKIGQSVLDYKPSYDKIIEFVNEDVTKDIK